MLSEGYLAQQQEMHINPRYGAASGKMASRVQKIVNSERPSSILDYGAGKCLLSKSINSRGAWFAEYDPCVPEIAELPAGKFHLVCCIDVLEHVEPEYLDDVLASIRSKTARTAFLTIHTGPAGKFLPDGRNAHLIQEGIEWWDEQLHRHFDTVSLEMVKDTTIVARATA